jgi:translation initiation factor 2 alpha subunit (eIF-2alpha)
MKFKENQLVIAKVKSIEGTTVFVDIKDSDIHGSIILPEVSAGRIRNLRDFVFPGKIVVCKILKIKPNNIELSIRRVSLTEQHSMLLKEKQESVFKNMLKSQSLKPEEIIQKIKSQHDLHDFLEQIRDSPKPLEKFIPKAKAQKISEQLAAKTKKSKTIKKTFSLSSTSSSGINDIKEILSIKSKDLTISYLGSNKFSISTTSDNPKSADSNLQSALEEIEKLAKSKKADFQLITKK